MNALQFRTRVSVLWVAVAVALAMSLLLYVFVPGAVEQMVAGEMEGEPLTDGLGFFFAALATIPLAMAAVALLIGDRANRWTNLIAGVLYGAFGAFAVISHVSAGDVNGHVVMAAVAGLLAFGIAGLGVAGVRQPRSEVAAPGFETERHREKATV